MNISMESEGARGDVLNLREEELGRDPVSVFAVRQSDGLPCENLEVDVRGMIEDFLTSDEQESPDERLSAVDRQQLIIDTLQTVVNFVDKLRDEVRGKMVKFHGEDKDPVGHYARVGVPILH